MGEVTGEVVFLEVASAAVVAEAGNLNGHTAIDTDTVRTFKNPCRGIILTNGHNGSTTSLHAPLSEILFDPFQKDPRDKACR